MKLVYLTPVVSILAMVTVDASGDTRRAIAAPLVESIFAKQSIEKPVRHETANFIVYAATPQIAGEVGKQSELHRKKIARKWLGNYLKRWERKCVVHINITLGQVGGATTFNFDVNGKGVLAQRMELSGPLDQILTCALPHEITHTIVAHIFRLPVPRWADEGAATLSEDEEGIKKQLAILSLVLKRRPIPLRRLFEMSDYPRDLTAFYAQAISVTQFLIKRKNRKSFLRFLKKANRSGWDEALKRIYQFDNVEHLEKAWLRSVQSKRAHS